MSRHSLPGKGVQGQVFAIGDIHGQAKTLEKALEHIAGAPRTGAPTHLVFTGDVIDRGHENLRCIELVLNASRYANVDQVTLIPGNHEIMMLMALEDPRLNMGPWASSGGMSVINEILPSCMSRPMDEIAETLSDKMSDFIAALEAAPNHIRIGDLVFVHGGVQPNVDMDEFLSQPRFGAGAYDEHWAWIRKPFLKHRDGWGGDDVIIHGHTPHNDGQKLDPALAHDYLDRVGSHRRICLDAGASRLGQLAILNAHGAEYEVALAQEVDFCPNLEDCDFPSSCEI